MKNIKKSVAVSISVSILLGIFLGLTVYLFYAIANRVTLKDPSPAQRSVVLDASWNRYFRNPSTTEEQKAYIDAMLDEVIELGADGIIWSARTTDGTLLFRSRARTVKTAEAVTANDGLLNRFDPLKYMVQGANQRGITLALLATDEGGSALTYSQCETQLSEAVARVANHYRMYLCAQADSNSNNGDYLSLYDSLSYYYTFAPAGSKLEDTLWWSVRCDSSPEILTAAMAAQGSDCNVILGNYSALAADPSKLELFWYWNRTLTQPQPDLTAVMSNKTVPQTLALGYPRTLNEQGSYTISTSTCFLMGTSNPGQNLTIEGGSFEEETTVERHGSRGVWGILVNLATGDNNFILKQGEEMLSFTIQRPQPTTSSPGGSTPEDGSTAAQEGQKLRVTETLCSALYSLNSGDNISQTLYKGAVATIRNSKQVTWSGKRTYAYQLSTGDWVLSGNVELIPMEEGKRLMTNEEFKAALEQKRKEIAKEKGIKVKDVKDEDVEKEVDLYAVDMVSSVPDAAFTGITVSQEETTHCQVLTLEGSGTPAVFHQWEGNTLKLTLLDAAIENNLPDADSFVQSYSVYNSTANNSATIVMEFSDSDPLWGWNVQYENGTTKIYLKKSPTVSTAPTGPLTGVTVLLDPGHGGDDEGAMGAAGGDAPFEREVNLAEATAARYRLEQLGATVHMTREDDTYYTLGERVEAMDTLRPDFFIALHHNSSELTNDINDRRGTEAYWFYTEGKDLAQRLVANVTAVTGRNDRGNFYDYYYVTRSNICPAVLLENGFMTNPGEYESVSDVTTLWAEGGAVAKAVLQCVQSGYTEAVENADLGFNPDKP